MPWERKGGGGIRIVSPPVPLTFCFETVGHLMDAVERAVHTLHVLSSALGRIGSRFFLCVTVRFSERIAARSRDEADWRAVIDEAAPWAEASFARHGVISILGL